MHDLMTGAPAISTPLTGDSAWDDWDSPPRLSMTGMLAAGLPATGSPAAPMLHLEGFDGPMDLLLDLAERQRIDLGQMSILALAEQFVAAFEQLRDRVALERRADWLVTATRLVLLRSRLLFPESPAAAEAAERDAATELRRIDDLAGLQAAAAWLGARPVLGLDVFARGAPEQLGVHLGTEQEVDVIASSGPACRSSTRTPRRPRRRPATGPSGRISNSVAEARDRILRILGKWGDGEAFGHFLPERLTAVDAGDREASLRLYSAWASTFSASLELARQSDVTLAQDEAFADIHVSRMAGQPSGAGAVNVSG